MNDCPSTEFIQRYRNGDLFDTEMENAFENHLRTCVSCRASLHTDRDLSVRALIGQILPTPASSRHISSEDLIALVKDELPAEEVVRIEEHLAVCRSCQIDLEDLRSHHQATAEQTTKAEYQDEYKDLVTPRMNERIRLWLVGFGNRFTDIFSLAVRKWSDLRTDGRLIIAIVLGMITGLTMRGNAVNLQNVGDVFLKILELLATLYIFVAIVHTLLRTEVTERTARRLVALALSNTFVAVVIGLSVGTVVQPGIRWHIVSHDPTSDALRGVISQPSSTVIGTLLNNTLLVVVSLALAFGITLRKTRQEQIQIGRQDYVVVQSFLMTIYRSLTLMLNGIVVLFPIAVFAVIAAQVGRLEWRNFEALLGFGVAVLVALLLQTIFYLLRLWFGARITPSTLLTQCRDPLLTAFSTASSALTLPLTYRTLRDKMNVRVRSAGVGILVGGQFNRDGTALYEAITPLFVAQSLGHSLTISQQLCILIMAIIASIAAPGLPNAGLVTMVLVFRTIDLPPSYILLLPAVDWFLDRCRTAVNVMGTITVACLLDRRTPPNDPRADATEHYDEVITPEVLD